jgi:hypothetical protein
VGIPACGNGHSIEDLVVELLGHARGIRIERRHAGVVDENVDGAEPVVGSVDQP